MRRYVGSAFLAAGLLAGCGPSETETSTQQPQEQQAHGLLTETDVDVAAECQGIIAFANSATYAKLDQYLPSNVVDNLVAARAAQPFVSLADVSAVRLVGPARLQQLEQGARSEDYIDADCYGIVEGLAVSQDDAAAIRTLVNSVSFTELYTIMPYAWNGAQNLANQRPFSNVDAIGATSGVGEVGFRNLRNAATLSRPFEALVAAVNALPGSHGGVFMARHFDWWANLNGQHYNFGIHECYGDKTEQFTNPNIPGQHRGADADGAEVRAHVAAFVNAADRFGTLDPAVKAAGLANLAALTEGRSFFGCSYGFAPDPWSGHSGTFFIDTENGFGVYTDSYWVE
ncbi:hypothetical protein [Corallococcus macrosporus]|uniref:Lipoprotein n=1 Tax=Corallococcus macrosporus DSM 14697 TaxID=1189310 RepID=A0A250JU26_9BACT|nr:hypothetical protein [Corallococcus macrosporus]ATB47193.1 hypothetical protein MYMAC_002801 [Corallococcus macrosporus DSM 14697]